MGKGEKYAALIVGLAMVTTLILPDRKTSKVIDSFGKAAKGILGTAMGTAKAA